MTGLLASNRRAETGAAPPIPAPVPEPGLGELFGATWRVTEDDIGTVNERRLFDGYMELERQLIRMGANPENLRHRSLPAFGLFEQRLESRTPNFDAIWAETERLRRTNPDAFREVAATREEFERRITTRNGGQARDMEVMSRSRGVAGALTGFTAAVGASMTDPVNIVTLPIGGPSKTVLGAVGRGALINGVVEAYQQPGLEDTRRVQGRELTGQEELLNITFAAVGGGVLEGGGRALADMAPAAREAVLARVYPLLPQRVRDRFTRFEDVPDDVLADVLEEVRGPDLSTDERGAINLIRRQSEIDAANPFARGPAGEAAHADNLTLALQRILDDAPPANMSRGSLSAGTSLGSGRGPVSAGQVVSDGVPVAGDGRSQFKARVRRSESGGNDRARNPNGSASGRYQFIESTFVSLYARSYGVSAAEARAAWNSDRRFAGDVQERLMDAAIDQYQQVFSRAGVPSTPGNLYLAHFFGPDMAVRVLRAAPDAPIRGIVGDAAVAANRRILEGKSAAEVIAWTRNAMGDPASGATLARVQDGVADDADLLLQAELDANARRQQELDDAAVRALAEDPDAPPEVAAYVPAIDGTLDDVVPVPETSMVPAWRPSASPQTPFMPVRRPKAEGDAAPVAPAAPPYRPETLAATRRLVTGSDVRLNDVAALAARVDASEAEMRAVLAELAKQKVIVQRVRRLKGRDGAPDTLATSYQRVPADTRNYAQALIARNGGIRDTPSQRGRGEHDIATRLQRRDGRGSAFVPGIGPLVRRMDDERAMTLDQVGELLFERGYLYSREPGNERGRPSISEVLDYLEEGMADPKAQLPESEIADMLQARAEGAVPDLTPEAQRAWFWSEETGAALDYGEAEDVGRIIAESEARGEPMEVSAAYAEMVNRQLVDLALDLWEELGDEADIVARIADIADEAGGRPAGRSASDGADAGAFETDAGARAARDDYYEQWEPADDGWRSLDPPESDGPWQDTAASKAWDDPAGPVAREQADSLAHDARVAAKGDDVMVANEDGELTPAFERELERATAAAQALEAEGKVPLFHATSGPWKSENPNGMGMVFHADDLMMAARYAGAGGGRRAVGNAGRIIVRELPADAKIIDITSREGVDELAQLPLAGRLSGVILRDARKATETGDLAVVNNSFWTITKRASANDAVEIKTFIVDELRRRGYDGIKFGDDRHDSFALFDRANEPPPSRDPADMFGGATRDEARQALERRGEGGLSNGAPQKPAGSDGGLFDAGTGRQAEFLLDADGAPRTIKDILDEIDEDQAAIKSIRDCL